MKKYKFYIIIALLFSAVVGCKDYLDINTNPNAPTVTVPGLVLSGALTETARIHTQDLPAYSAYWVGYWSASGTYSSSGDTRRFFNLTNVSNQGVWNNNYLNASNYDFVETTAKRLEKYDYYIAISKIMKVYNFHTLIDNYGNIPYFTALKGFKSLSPTYDDASLAYESLSNQLDSAVMIIQNAPADAVSLAPTTDIMFQGQMNQWAKLANTMNLRLLLRQSALPGKATFINGMIAKILANGAGFLGVGEDSKINPGYAKTANNQNPFWESNGLGVGDDIGGRDYNRSSEYGVKFFTGAQYGTTPIGNKLPVDPRANRLFRAPNDLPGINTGPDTTNLYKGIPFGADPDLPYTTSKTSGPGLGVMGSAGSPVVFLSAAQSLLLQAEAVHYGWLAGSEQALYEAGVTESFRLLGVPGYANAASTYLSSGVDNVDFTNASTDGERLETIIVQKWAANYSIDPMESWSDLRRTGYPNDLPESLAAAKINPTPPIRLLYPQTEFSNNAGAVAKALSDQGLTGNYQFASKIFWDAN